MLVVMSVTWESVCLLAKECVCTVQGNGYELRNGVVMPTMEVTTPLQVCRTVRILLLCMRGCMLLFGSTTMITLCFLNQQ